MFTYAIKWEEKILVTFENREQLSGYKFIQEENKEEEIKLKYKNIIFSKYSLTDQLNMSNEALLITSSVQYEKRELKEYEILKLNEIKEAKLWIDEQRKLCSEEIEKINK